MMQGVIKNQVTDMLVQHLTSWIVSRKVVSSLETFPFPFNNEYVVFVVLCISLSTIRAYVIRTFGRWMEVLDWVVTTCLQSVVVLLLLMTY